jgi:hypothetical protein
METTCRLVYPSRGIEDEAVWSPHAASFPLLPAALKTRRCGVHTLPRFPSFLGHRRRGGVESTRRLVSPLSWGIEDEAVWSPHAASFPLFPGASKTRRCGVHTPPRFPSSLGHRRRGSVESTHRLVSPLPWSIEDEAAWIPHAASFPSSLGHRRRGGVDPTRRLVSLLHRGIEDEAAWSPHATSFPLFTVASKTRRHETHTPPCFFSFPQRQPCLGSFHIFCLYLELPSFLFING